MVDPDRIFVGLINLHKVILNNAIDLIGECKIQHDAVCVGSSPSKTKVTKSGDVGERCCLTAVREAEIAETLISVVDIDRISIDVSFWKLAAPPRISAERVAGIWREVVVSLVGRQCTGVRKRFGVEHSNRMTEEEVVRR